MSLRFVAFASLLVVAGCGGSSGGGASPSTQQPIATDEVAVFEDDAFFAAHSPWALPSDPDVQMIGGRWTMFFSANQLATSLEGKAQLHVLAATLPPGAPLSSPPGQWSLLTAADGSPLPVISPSADSSAWDGWGIETPKFVHGWDATRGAWVDRIYYTGWTAVPAGTPWNVAIGFAEWDGAGYAKHGPPVITPTQPYERFGAGWQMDDQTVLYVPAADGGPGAWHMYYSATTDQPSVRIQTVHARSSDGVTWPADQRELLDASPIAPEPELCAGPYAVDCIAHDGAFLLFGFLPGGGARDGLYVRSYIGPPADGATAGRWKPMLYDLVGPAWRTAGLTPRPVNGDKGSLGLMGSCLAADGGALWLFSTGFRDDGGAHKPTIGRARIDPAKLPAATSTGG